MNQALLNFSTDELVAEIKERSESVIIAYDVGDKKHCVGVSYKGDARKNITSAYRILVMINAELARSGIPREDIHILHVEAMVSACNME